MPDRDYYLNPSPRMTVIRDKYIAHIAAVLRLAGLPVDQARADGIFQLEHSIAETHWDRTDTGDIQKGNNHWPRREFAAKAPGLDWTRSFPRAASPGRTISWCGSPAPWRAFPPSRPPNRSGYGRITWHSAPSSTWPESCRRNSLPKAFAFYGTALAGVPRPRDRWKRAVDATNGALGDAVGKLYVKKYFPASEKARAKAMVGNLIAAFLGAYRQTGMDGARDEGQGEGQARRPGRRRRLSRRLGRLFRAGDPPRRRVRQPGARGTVRPAVEPARLGQVVDRSEWVMTPQTVNAVNLPAMNAMNFPAAILQPPFFDPSVPRPWTTGPSAR